MSVKTMMSKTVLAVALAWIAFSITPAIARETSVETLDWDLNVSAQGSVEKMTRVGKGGDAVREQLEAAMQSWHFSAGAIDGKPVASTTSIGVNVKLDPIGDDDWRVTIMSASTGARFDSGDPPVYPTRAIVEGREGLVVVEASYDVDGKVTDAILYKHSPLTEGDLVELAFNAVRKFKYQPEKIGSNAVAGKVLAPVCFTVSSSKVSPEQRCSWRAPDGSLMTEQTTMLAISPIVVLQSKVAGIVLSP